MFPKKGPVVQSFQRLVSRRDFHKPNSTANNQKGHTMARRKSEHHTQRESDDTVSRRDFLRTSAIGVSAAAVASQSTRAAATQQTVSKNPETEPAHFHHVHLNVTEPRETLRFYQFMFGAIPVRFRGVADALYTERSFILFDQVAEPPASALESGIWHLGWGSVDVPSEYKWWKDQGMDVHTPIYQLGRGFVSYWNGPDKEVIELNTQGHHRFSHVHFMAADVNETAGWYTENLGLRGRPPVPKPEDLSTVRAWSTGFRCDNVSFIVYGQPNYEPRPPWWRWEPLTDFQPQQGRAIDHIAFSYRNIEPVFERMQKSGVEIVRPIEHDQRFNMKSFYVMAPDKVTIEIVEARPIPEGVWDA